MDLNSVRRVSSAGYRLPERNNGTRPKNTQRAADKTRNAADAAASAGQNADKTDPVKQDQVWRESVWRERTGVREWEKNWGFLRNYDQMGQQRPEEPLPSYVSFFSDGIPNTTNRMFGSRVSTPLGRELVRMDRLALWSGSHHKCKLDPEMLPC